MTDMEALRRDLDLVAAARDALIGERDAACAERDAARAEVDLIRRGAQAQAEDHGIQEAVWRADRTVIFLALGMDEAIEEDLPIERAVEAIDALRARAGEAE